MCFMYLVVYLCVSVHARNVYACVSRVSFSMALHLIFETRSLIEPEAQLARLIGWPASSRNSPVLTSPVLELLVCNHHT